MTMTFRNYPKTQCPLATIGNVISGLCHILYFIPCLTPCAWVYPIFSSRVEPLFLSHSLACSLLVLLVLLLVLLCYGGSIGHWIRTLSGFNSAEPNFPSAFAF